MNVRWVIQKNLLAESDMKGLKEALDELGIEVQEVFVLPFVDALPEEIIFDDKVNIYYGGTTFMYNLYKKLKPAGLFFDETTFQISNYIEKWGEHMLNYGAKITTLNEFSKEDHNDEEMFFVRPNADDKSFDGMVINFKSIKNWQNNSIQHDDTKLSGESPIVVGMPYNISKEWRNYIVDGEIVGCSLYRTNFRLTKSNTDIPEEMLAFVRERIKEYQPHGAFAMDIALTGGQYYIIECGCINSVGFYAADKKAILQKLTEYVSKKN